MLLKYGAKNFLSFNEGIEVPFELNSNCPESISQGKLYTNVLCVKGANGSGKTNVLEILDFLNIFCCNSFSNKPDEKIDCKPFFDSTEPSDFYIEFIINNIEYRYELSLNKDQVLSETIYRKAKRLVKVLERQNNQITYSNKDFDDVKIIKLRSNASIISTANQYEIKSLSIIYNFFYSISTNIKFNHSGSLESISSLSDLSKVYFDHTDLFRFVEEIIYKCDLGITSINIGKIEDVNKNDRYFPIFWHKNKNNEKSLTFFDQSSGSKALFHILPKYWLTLNVGGVLVLDEFDINLHSHILPLLVDLFTDPEKNIHEAQLIFTTHNTEIMDILGKYRTFLVNKEDNESYGYRLDEIPGDMIRNDRLISPLYNEGKIGGIPRL